MFVCIYRRSPSTCGRDWSADGPRPNSITGAPVNVIGHLSHYYPANHVNPVKYIRSEHAAKLPCREWRRLGHLLHIECSMETNFLCYRIPVQNYVKQINLGINNKQFLGRSMWVITCGAREVAVLLPGIRKVASSRPTDWLQQVLGFVARIWTVQMEFRGYSPMKGGGNG